MVSEDYPLPGVDFDKSGQRELIINLCEKYREKLVIIGLRSSYELNDYPHEVTYVCSYSSRTCSAIAMARIIKGEMKLAKTATPPVSLRF